MRTISRSLCCSVLLPFFFAGVVGCAADVDADAGAGEHELTGKAETALVATAPIAFVGSADRSWFNPKNWSTGRVPGASDDVVLDGTDDVLVDPAARGGAGKVVVHDLRVRGSARLEVIGGAIVESHTENLAEHGQIIFRGSANASESLVVEDGADGSATSNPSTQSHRDVILKTSFTMNVGIGGVARAALERDAAGAPVLHAGFGHYATTTADTIAIDGHLRLGLYYGFSPRAGDTFEIVTARRTRTGEFIGLPEGSYVGCTEDAVCLRISYQGGDGNDIVLSAENVEPEVALLLPAIQKVREAAAR